MPDPITIVNNTTSHQESYPNETALYIYTPQVATAPVTVLNNIFGGVSSSRWTTCNITSDQLVQTVDYNLLHGADAAYCGAVTGGAHDQLHRSPHLFDDDQLHLYDGSPAIDAGTGDGAPGTDFEGDARPANGGIDIGADENPLPVDLAVTKNGPTCGLVMEEMRYTISVSNFTALGTASSVLVTDTIPAGTAVVSVTPEKGTCTGTGPLTCALGTLAPSETVNIEVVLQPANAGNVAAPVVVTSSETDEEPNNNKDVLIMDIASLPTSPVDLEPTAVEVIQATQSLANDVQLIADKPTFARVYARSDVPLVENVGALLHGSRDGKLLPGSPLSPLLPWACTDVRDSGANRFQLEDSIVFELPPAWRSDVVDLEVELNPGGVIPETDTGNNRLRESVRFIGVPPICLRTYPVRTAGTFPWGESSDRLHPFSTYLFHDRDGLLPRALTLLPTAEIWVFPESHLLQELEYTPLEFGPFELNDENDDGDRIIYDLWWIDQTSDDPDQCDDARARTHYLGMVHDRTYDIGDWGGQAPGAESFLELEPDTQLLVRMSPEPVGESFNNPWGGRTLAHELGHNYGVAHVGCGEADKDEDSYPYDPCRFSSGGETSFIGLDTKDVASTTVITAEMAGDLMSYAPNRWISDYTWHKIGLVLCEANDLCVWEFPTTRKVRTEPQSPLLVTDELLLISGTVTDTVQVDHVYRLPREQLPPAKLERLARDQSARASLDSPYEVLLVDADGNVLYREPVALHDLADSRSPVALFLLALPYFPNMAEVRIEDQGSIVATRTRSANAPTITLLTPNGGGVYTDTIPVAWEATDEDGGELRYLLQYSPDLGDTWQTLVFDVPTTAITVDSSLLSGSPEQGLIRVIANDGINTSSDMSDAAFTVTDRAPLVAIQAPLDGATFDPLTPITVRGQAYDPEEGRLPGDSLQWTVTKLGAVGTGTEVILPSLPAGQYEVTLTATDGHGQTGMVSVSIQVEQRASPPSPGRAPLYLPIVMH